MLIKPVLTIRAAAGLVVVASLLACTSPPGRDEHAEHHPPQSASTSAAESGMPPAPGGIMGSGMAGSSAGCGVPGGTSAGTHAGCAMMGSSQAGSQAAGAGAMQEMNKEEMCAAYRNMRTAPNEQARQAMMDRHMPHMSSEMRQQRMEMMRQQCH